MSAEHLIPFKKGQSGNPAGTSKIVREVKRHATTCSLDALKRLVHLSEHARSESTQVQACVAILDRALGKPKQEMSVEGAGAILASIKVAFINVGQNTELGDSQISSQAPVLIPAE
jgi:hypothetical protein